MRAALTIAAAAALLTSCARIQWSRSSINEPVDAQLIETLAPDRDDLTACLAALGAPVRVWEAADGGVAMAYGWLDADDWGFSVSYSVARFVSASFSYGEVLTEGEGVVLVFDRDLILRDVRAGQFADIAAEPGRRRPNDVHQLN